MALSEETLSAQVSSYKSTCEKHPELNALDTALQAQTTKVIKSLAAQAETGSLSKHTSHVEIYSYILEVNKVVADSITESNDDVWDNEELRSLVKAYFDNTSKTLEFFNTVEKCVNDAEMSQLYMQSAVQHFDKEFNTDVGGNKKKYGKTLEELKKLKGMRDHFTANNLTTQFEEVKKDHVSLLAKVIELKKELDEKLSHLQTSRKVTNIVFGAVFGCVVVLSVAAFAFGGAAVLAGMAITGAGVGVGLGLSLPLIALGWVATSVVMDKLEKTLKKQAELTGRMHQSLEITKDAMDNIHHEVDGLITKITLILDSVDNALVDEEDEIDMKAALKTIMDHIDAFTKKITELGEDVDKNSKLIIDARLRVLEKISSSGEYKKR